MRRLILIALMLSGCAQQPAPPPEPVPVVAPQQPAPVAPEPPLAEHEPVSVPAAEPYIVVKAAKPERLTEQTQLHRFKAAHGHIAVSPDGRYLLYSACDPCDERRIYTPVIWDRTTGATVTGKEPIQGWHIIREIPWSGNGFWTDPLVHVGLDGTITLRTGVVPEGWELAAAEVSPDGKHVAEAISPKGNQVEALDLLIDGRQYPKALPSEAAQRGYIASLAWAPDSATLVACGTACYLIDLAKPEPEHWRPLPALERYGTVRWAPDGKHLLLTRTGIFTREGELQVTAPEPTLWNSAGTAAIAERGRLVEVRLDGTRLDHGELSRFQWVVGWLPDKQIILVDFE